VHMTEPNGSRQQHTVGVRLPRAWSPRFMTTMMAGWMSGIPVLHRATEKLWLLSFEDNAADVAKLRNVCERC